MSGDERQFTTEERELMRAALGLPVDSLTPADRQRPLRWSIGADGGVVLGGGAGERPRLLVEKLWRWFEPSDSALGDEFAPEVFETPASPFDRGVEPPPAAPPRERGLRTRRQRLARAAARRARKARREGHRR